MFFAKETGGQIDGKDKTCVTPANAANEEVNLPQTGNNSLSSIALAFAAFAMTGIGMAAVVGSGVLKKKEENE